MNENLPRIQPTDDDRERARRDIDETLLVLSDVWADLSSDDIRLAGETLAWFWAVGRQAGVSPAVWRNVTSLPVGILDALRMSRRFREGQS